MATLTREVTVDAPAEEVFDYCLDPRRLWAVPEVALTEVDVKPDGVRTTTRLWSHLLGFHIEGVLEYKEVSRPERIVIDVSWGFLEHPTWTFTFAQVDGGTTVTAQGEWHMKTPVVGGPMEKRMVKEHEPFLESMLARLKAGVEVATVG